MQTVPVQFVGPWRNYYPGDVAGFTPELAGELCAAGAAVPHVASGDTATVGYEDRAMRPAARRRRRAPVTS